MTLNQTWWHIHSNSEQFTQKYNTHFFSWLLIHYHYAILCVCAKSMWVERASFFSPLQTPKRPVPSTIQRPDYSDHPRGNYCHLHTTTWFSPSRKVPTFLLLLLSADCLKAATQDFVSRGKCRSRSPEASLTCDDFQPALFPSKSPASCYSRCNHGNSILVT